VVIAGSGHAVRAADQADDPGIRQSKSEERKNTQAKVDQPPNWPVQDALGFFSGINLQYFAKSIRKPPTQPAIPSGSPKTLRDRQIVTLRALRHAVDLLRNHSAIRASVCLRRFYQEGHVAGSLEPGGTSKRLRICVPDDIGNPVRLPSTLTSGVWTMSIEQNAPPNRRPRFGFGCAGFIGCWIRSHRTFPAAVGGPWRWRWRTHGKIPNPVGVPGV
jgi:hypothetical protein